jgi:hypothetical protein
MRRLPALLFAILCTSATWAHARELTLQGAERWIVIASRKTADEAIGVARVYTSFKGLRVVQSSNGWFGVVAGPLRVTNAGAQKDVLIKQQGAPGDMIFSRGENYVAQVWTYEEPVAISRLKFEGGRAAAGRFGDMTLRLSARKADDEHTPVLELLRNGKPVFSTALDDQSISNPNAEAIILRLDASTRDPQILFTSFWGGAHCCTMSQIITNANGAFIAVEGQTLDGEGYSFADIDKDGTSELLSLDNSFLYAFASYADSFAPLRISKLAGDKLVDATAEPRFRSHLRQDVYRMEHFADREPDVWRNNGFLGAWVAAKAQIGEFDDAWTRMLKLHDKSSDWPLTECAVAEVKGVCPQGKEIKLTFPEALRKHLLKTGYISAGTLARPTPAVVPGESGAQEAREPRRTNDSATRESQTGMGRGAGPSPSSR